VDGEATPDAQVSGRATDTGRRAVGIDRRDYRSGGPVAVSASRHRSRVRRLVEWCVARGRSCVGHSVIPGRAIAAVAAEYALPGRAGRQCGHSADHVPAGRRSALPGVQPAGLPRRADTDSGPASGQQRLHSADAIAWRDARAARGRAAAAVARRYGRALARGLVLSVWAASANAQGQASPHGTPHTGPAVRPPWIQPRQCAGPVQGPVTRATARAAEPDHAADAAARPDALPARSCSKRTRPAAASRRAATGRARAVPLPLSGGDSPADFAAGHLADDDPAADLAVPLPGREGTTPFRAAFWYAAAARSYRAADTAGAAARAAVAFRFDTRTGAA
jgi:hypothetical protein